MRYPAPVATLVPLPQFLGAEDLLVQPSSTSDLGGEVIPAAPDGARAPAGESEEDAEEAHAGHALARAEADGEQRDEDRHRRVGDRGHARVHVLLAPGD